MFAVALKQMLEDHAGVISLDMKNINSILEIDKTSRTALIEGGILGPDLEAQLKNTI